MNFPRTIAASCALIGATFLTGPALAADQCFNQVIGQIVLPMNLTKVPQEAHVMASVMTSVGPLEARAAREAEGNSQVTFFLAGKELKPVSPSELRPETRKCDRKRKVGSISEQMYAALSYLRTSIIPDAEARYISKYGCGSGPIEIKRVECWSQGGEEWCSYRFIQRGRTCGWAIASNAN